MQKTNENYSDKLFERIKYGIDLSFNKLLDEKRKNGEVFVFMQDGKVVHVNANDVQYREIEGEFQILCKL
jgi:major membrane immunogen (membrane-anchored lipoprotein)